MNSVYSDLLEWTINAYHGLMTEVQTDTTDYEKRIKWTEEMDRRLKELNEKFNETH